MTPRDPGVQPERTRMAWRRTTLAFAVVGVLEMRAALHGGGPAAYPAAALCALIWVGFLGLSQRRIRALAPHRPRAMHLATAWGTALCVVAAAVCAAVLVG